MNFQPHLSDIHRRPVIEGLERRIVFSSLSVFPGGYFPNQSAPPLPSGSVLPTEYKSTFQNYGFVRLNDTQTNRVNYFLYNIGLSDITVQSVTVPAGFRIAEKPAPNALIKPYPSVGDGSLALFIELDPSVPGYHKGNVVIKSSDYPDGYRFEIDGTVGAFSVNPSDSFYSLGAIGAAPVARSGTLNYQKLTDSSASNVIVPGVHLYEFALSDPRNEVTLSLSKGAPSLAFPINSVLYRDVDGDHVLDLSEESTATPPVRIDDATPSSSLTFPQQFVSGTYFLKCQLEANGSSTPPVNVAYQFSLSAAALPDPRLVVTRSDKSAPIADNDLSVSASDGTDLGGIAAGAPLSRTFNVRNDGKADLVLDPAATLSNTTDFAISGGLPKVIPAGGSANWTLLLKTNNIPGNKSTEIRIPTNDPHLGTDKLFNFKVQATVNPVVSSDSTPPKATLLTALRLRQTGGTFYKFTVRFDDETGIGLGSIASSNLNVTGPNGFVSQVRLLSKTQVGSKTVDGFYRLAAPGGSWDSSDNGLYTINVLSGQVKDNAGHFIPPGATTMPKTRNGVLIPGQSVPGQFTVKIFAPASILAPLFSRTSVVDESSEDLLD